MPSTLAGVISDMEGGLRDVEGWSKALVALGGSNDLIDPHGVAMMACALREAVKRLNDQWKTAHLLCHPSDGTRG